jgi:2-phosphosulfolactate phosphatase
MPEFKFHYTNLETCHKATDVVIVIDVIRAFTNAAYAFARGAKEIYPVSKVEEAFTLKAEIPNSFVCGEVGGAPPEGFDFGNSPTQTDKLDLRERILIQRTSAGTQGIVRSINANTMLAASLVVADATARYVRQLASENVTFVITGQGKDKSGEEDLACAEYIEALLKGLQPDPAVYSDRVYNSRTFILEDDFPAFPKLDLDHCAKIGTFDFAMLVTQEQGRHVMRTVKTSDHKSSR